LGCPSAKAVHKLCLLILENGRNDEKMNCIRNYDVPLKNVVRLKHPHKMKNTNWTNRLSFIITTSAFSVGLGNIWRFPYITGEGGGGAFLLVYLVLILLVGIPIMTIEIGLGRMSGTTTLLGYGKLAKRPFWNIVGWLEVLTVMLIMMFYVMILAWVLIYFGESLSGNIQQLNSEDLPNHFSGISSNVGLIILVIVGILLGAMGIVSQGLQAGLERYSKWMMITLFILLIGLAIWASTLEGASEGYRWFLYPDFSKINLNVVLSALGQLFFSLGVGMAAAFVFGSYTSKDDNLISSTAWVVFADSFIAILAGLMIFPALFSFGLSPNSGPNLIFITMASVFGKLDWGQGLGAVFFLLLFFAGFTSLITCMQGMKDSFRDRYEMKESRALWLVAGLLFVGSIPMVLSYLEDPIQIFGSTIYQIADYLTGTIMLPLAGLMIVVFGGHVLGYEKLRDHLMQGSEEMRIGNYWKFILKWIVPLALLIILINGLI